MPAASAAALVRPLEERLVDWGVRIELSADRLAAYHRVENTYLSTFQSLGALGLVDPMTSQDAKEVCDASSALLAIGVGYHAIPTNIDALQQFRRQVTRHWHRALRRRSQQDRTPWSRMTRLADRWLPVARIQHPWPTGRFDARTRGGSPVR